MKKTISFCIICLLIIRSFAQFYDSLNSQNVFDENNLQAHSSIKNNNDTLSAFVLNKGGLIQSAPIQSMELMLGKDLTFTSSLGYILQTDKKRKFQVNASFYFTIAKYPDFIGEKFDSMKYFAYSGRPQIWHKKTKGALFMPILIQYNINNILALEGGNGRYFLGDGYRSMLLSDQCAEYPFLRARANLKSVKYIYQIARWRQQFNDGNKQTKLSATHYLSIMLTKKISLSFFESVIWKTKDSVRTRGMEWQYANPLIFLRPAEFAIGSPDNVLMGVNFAWNIFEKTKIYTQIALDEFYISEIKNEIKHLLHPNDKNIPHGAWVNKYAYQIGVKSTDIFETKGLSCLIELNSARPYMWSHRDPMLSFSHLNQPLAHPFAANFYEFVFRFQYQNTNWKFLLNTNYYKTGYDRNDTHFGQNILQSTFDSYVGYNNIPVAYYKNIIGQGIQHKIFQINLECQQLIKLKNTQFIWRIGTILREDKSVAEKQLKPYFYTGIFFNTMPIEWNQR